MNQQQPPPQPPTPNRPTLSPIEFRLVAGLMGSFFVLAYIAITWGTMAYIGLRTLESTGIQDKDNTPPELDELLGTAPGIYPLEKIIVHETDEADWHKRQPPLRHMELHHEAD